MVKLYVLPNPLSHAEHCLMPLNIFKRQKALQNIVLFINRRHKEYAIDVGYEYESTMKTFFIRANI
jgi:hypothetical protein